MSRKSKIEPVEKVEIVEQIGLNEAARLSDSHSNDTVITWIRIYEDAGRMGLEREPIFIINCDNLHDLLKT